MDEHDENVDKILAEVRKIAESKFPVEITDKLFKEAWVTGYISGYLYRVTEEIINKSKTNLKTKN